ncbi:amidohydrolase 2 [Lactarius quietus]|nr:amidohydrolase 2 [Lactarius quietus]
MANAHDPESYINILRDYPAIDNHAHPLLTAENRNRLAFEGVTSEAEGPALEDAVYTLAHSTARRDIARLYGLPLHTSWEGIKKYRSARSYDDLCRLCFEKAKIQCILIDDGLPGVKEMAEEHQWHDRYTSSPTRRIVRVEAVAEELQRFAGILHTRLKASANNPIVAGFKTVVLRVRLKQKALNDFVVRMTLEIAAEHNKPVQFHTGLGDADITLTRANPAHLQPLIAKFPRAKFVLLHASYPYTREAGYLTAVYKNVYLDIGEVFPVVSKCGQETLIRQVLELVPTNKLMWSSDGHWWPETYYLGSHQARQALSLVSALCWSSDEYVANGVAPGLAGSCKSRRTYSREAARVAKDILFHTANRVYLLGLEVQNT